LRAALECRIDVHPGIAERSHDRRDRDQTPFPLGQQEQAERSSRRKLQRGRTTSGRAIVDHDLEAWIEQREGQHLGLTVAEVPTLDPRIDVDVHDARADYRLGGAPRWITLWTRRELAHDGFGMTTSCASSPIRPTLPAFESRMSGDALRNGRARTGTPRSTLFALSARCARTPSTGCSVSVSARALLRVRRGLGLQLALQCSGGAAGYLGGDCGGGGVFGLDPAAVFDVEDGR